MLQRSFGIGSTVGQKCESSLPVCSTDGIKLVEVLAQTEDLALHRNPGAPRLGSPLLMFLYDDEVSLAALLSRSTLFVLNLQEQ